MSAGIRLSAKKIATRADRVHPPPPWDMLSVDVMGPFIGSKRGERYILSVIDCFSKYLILVPLRDHTAPSVSKALYERVIGYFGCPRKFLSDRGDRVYRKNMGLVDELVGGATCADFPLLPPRQWHR